MIRAEREKIFATPAVLGDDGEIYGETRQPDEEESG